MTPIVLIPGFLGTRLRNRESRAVTWGSLRALYGSVTRLREERVHLTEEENPNAPDDVFAGVTVVPGLVRHDFYRHFRRTLLKRGYVPGKTLFLWSYDWRLPAATLAGQLGAMLDRIGGPVHAVAHSTGGLLLEYYLRYGATPLDRAGEPTFDTAGRFASIAWVGATMRGTVIAARDLFNGYRPAPGGVRIPVAVAITYPGLYDAFPFDGRILLGPDGRTLDLNDPQLWEAQRWPLRKRRDKREMRQFHGDRFDAAAAAIRHVESARRLHEALQRGPVWPPGRHWIVTNDRIPTQARIPMRATVDGLVPEFPRYRKAVAAHFEDGDMTVTLSSQLRGTPRDALPAGVELSLFNCRHRYLVSHPPVVESLLRRVAD